MRLCGCLWLGGYFEDLTSARLGCAFDRKIFSRPLLWWYFIDVLSNSQTVDANVEVRSPEANKLQRDGKRNSDDPRWECTENNANNCIHPPSLERSAHVGLFVEELNSLIIMP
jgi:hypothetical protein